MRQHIAPALLIALTLSGCATPPRSVQGVRESQPVGASVCSTLSVEEAAQRIEQGWRRCHAQPKKMVFVGGDPTVQTQHTSDGYAVSLAQPGSGITVMVADVRKTATCTAEVTARGWNFAWQARASKVSRYLDNPDVACGD